MSQRHSGYNGGNEFYTPPWPVEALLSVEEFGDSIWECAAGQGHMVRALVSAGRGVIGTEDDFLARRAAPEGVESIITNPPYSIADDFIDHALELMEAVSGKVAMLLPVSFDAANGTRSRHRTNRLFCHPAFDKKYILHKRIRWEGIEQKPAGPSAIHAWFVWDFQRLCPTDEPTLGYLP